MGRPPREKLTKRQALAIAYIARGHSYNATARLLEVDERTIHKWRKDSRLFREAFEEAIENSIEAHRLDIQQLIGKAYEELGELLKDSNAQVRLGACRLTLEMHSRIITAAEEREALAQLEARMETLQQAAQQQQLRPAEPEPVDVVIEPVALPNALDGDGPSDEAPAALASQ